jgi:lactoylglutathione lyase
VKLNHVNLTVSDVQAARRFLERYFGLRSPGGGKKNFDVLFDDNGLVLTLIGAGKGKTVAYPPSFHIGFMQPTEEDVDRINARLREDGFEVEPPQRLHGWTFYVEAPGGFTVEVLC